MIGQGRTAEVYECKENKVVKLFKDNICKDAIANEYRINQALHNSGIPVAKTYDLVKVDGRYGIVYEYVKAPSMMKVLASKPWKADQLAKMMANLHKTLQKNVDIKSQNQNEKIKGNIALTSMLSNEIKHKLYDYIDTLPNDDILCHGDLHPDNILISKDKVIVIDWMTATKGNPLSDIASTSIMFKYGVVPEEMTYLQKCIVRHIRHRFLQQYLKRYIKITGEKLKEIEKWEVPMAAARLVVGIPAREKEQLKNFINKKMSVK